MRDHFFDIHTHVYKYPYPYRSLNGKYIFPTPEQMVAVHERVGVTGGALMVLCNAEEYVPQSVGEVIDIANASGGRYVPFCNLDPRAMNNTPNSHLEYLLDHFKSLGCKGVGEVLPRMAFDDPKMMNLYRAAESVGLPLLFDMNSSPKCSYGLFDEPGLVRLRRALEAYPDLVFIGHGPGFWAEFGTLRAPEDRYGYPKYPIDGEGMIPKLMREYPNLWVDLSAGSGLIAVNRDLEYTQKFFEEFSDRILYGTDICFADDEPGQSAFMNNMLDSGRITERVYDMIARENAQRLLNI